MRTRGIPLLTLFIALYTFLTYAQTFTVLHDFGASAGDPTDPMFTTRIAQGRDGNLYSTGSSGGTGAGAVFRITPAGKITVLYNFCSLASCADGQSPQSGLTLGTDGSFYGTTVWGGGTSGNGTIYKITPAGALTVLHQFNAKGGSSDGWDPLGAPVEGLDGNFYGTTAFGGGPCGCGTIYRITPSGTFTVLHAFAGGSADGGYPHAPLILGVDGNLYGTTTSQAFAAFRISTAGKYVVLNATLFSEGQLAQSTNSNFYGSGGTGNQIFRMTTGGVGTVLYTLNGGSNGNSPRSGLIRGSDGNFYGTTQSGGTTTNCSSNLGSCGVVYRMTPAGGYSVLFDFENPDGYEPGPILQHTNGNLYGQTNFGGTINGVPSDNGTFFRLTENLLPFGALLPYTGKVGSTIGFLGQGFTSTSTVSFNGTVAVPISFSGTFLRAKVPAGATSGIVSVTTSTGTLKSLYKFRVMPQITSFSPTSGAVGAVVKITGLSLTQTSAVTFGGAKANTFTVNSDTQVTATIPTAAKTGRISVTTAGGTATSATNFDVKPTIGSFTPTSGAVGTKVTINGSGFTGVTRVAFNGVAAAFTVVNSTQLTATVPASATTGPISVTTAGGTATSSGSFGVT